MQSEQLVEAEHSVQRLQRVRPEQSCALVLRDALQRLAVRVRRLVVLHNQREDCDTRVRSELSNRAPQSLLPNYRSTETARLLLENSERCESVHCGDEAAMQLFALERRLLAECNQQLGHCDPSIKTIKY